MDFEIDAKIAEYEARGARQAMLGLTDIDGVLRGKYVGFDKLKSLFAKGGGFCDCVFGWDVDDQLYDGGAVTGWHSGFPDARYRLLSASERALPESGTPYFVGEFASDDANDHPVCPRTLLRRILARADGLGLTAKAGFEYELFVFDEDADSVRDKGFRNLQPLTPGNFGYSVLRAASNSEIFQALMDYCADFRMPLEGLHCETGPGVWEAALAVADGLEAADRAALFKTFSKAFFAKRGAMATFMAKWSMDYPGQSGHYHFSLLDSAGANVFADASTDVPDRARWALGGLVRYAGEFLPMLAPTINSFTRLVKGAWAPTAATWGIDNRTAAFRFIPGDDKSQHIEARVGGADGNPYLVAAATLGAAILGIEQRIEPPEAVSGNAYDVEDGQPWEWRFAPTLRDAANRLGQSRMARELFGEQFVDHYVSTRLWESREYERHVNDWQLSRYFEII
ncbi:MAG: glutamine synthetase [Gammaproteobacteria bacterium]|nr:glutamine synthetase [Gammaproteobacteria bacterium]